MCKEFNQSYIFVEDFKPSHYENAKFDWLLNLWGSYIFKNDVFQIVNDTLNIHPSLLPYGRGKDPIVWSIQDGVMGGATVLRMNEAVDAGDIWVQEAVPYEMPTTGGDLYDKVIAKCIELFISNWEAIRSHRIQATKQGATSCPTRKRKDLNADRLIDFDKLDESERRLLRRILSHDFGSNYSSQIRFKDRVYSIKLQMEE